MNFQERYQSLVLAKHPSAARQESFSYHCLCCRDEGIVPIDVVQRYLQDDETELLGTSASPILCVRAGCTGNRVTVKTADETEISVAKYADYAVRNILNPQGCLDIHKWELERFQGQKTSLSENDRARAVSAQVHQIAVEKTLQKDAAIAEVVDIPSAEAPPPVFRVGDRVKFTSMGFPQGQRKQVIQELGEFLNAVGVVVRCEWVELFGHYRYHVQVGNAIAKYPDSYMIREEAAA